MWVTFFIYTHKKVPYRLEYTSRVLIVLHDCYANIGLVFQFYKFSGFYFTKKNKKIPGKIFGG